METYKFFGILESDTINHVEVKEKKKRIPKENEKTTRNQTIKQKSCQKDKYQDCTPHNILGTILKVDERKTSTNGPENKKILEMA